MSFKYRGILLNTMIVVGLVATLCGAFQRFVGDWQPIWLIIACGLVVLEVGLVHSKVRTEHWLTVETARYLIPELFLLVVLMRLAASLGGSMASLRADLVKWLYDPFSVFDSIFFAYMLVGMVAAFMAYAGLRDLYELEPKPSEAKISQDETNLQYVRLISQDRSQALRRINMRFISGGILLLCILSVEAVNTEQFGAPGRAISLLSASGALAYLIGGFLLYSQSRLAVLQARWLQEGAQIADSVNRRWTWASILLIGGVASLAVLLPRTYGMTLIDTLRIALGWFGYVLTVIGYAIIWIFTSIAVLPALLLSLFANDTTSAPPPALPSFTPPPMPEAVARQPHLLSSLVFWLCMLLLVGYAIMLFLQRHPGLVRALTTRGPLAWLLRQLGIVWRDTVAWVDYATTQLRERRRQSVGSPQRIPSLRLNKLPPRELVRYFYRSTLRRAAEQGLGRRRHQTPYEYHQTLAAHLPDAEQESRVLTDAFVRAQYSPQPIEAEQVQGVRGSWERLRARLRALRNPRDTSS